MKILLTGGSGFLGKKVLELLLADSRVTQVQVVTRSRKSHPSPRVKILPVDLIEPTTMSEFSSETQGVIHLAGLYDFDAKYSECYQQNVLSTLNLIQLLRQWNSKHHVPLIDASTYAVGFESKRLLKEEPLQELPSKSIAYAHTKAVAEKAVTDSGLPAAVFRLGILVGDTEQGEIEKIDGPYYFIKLVRAIQNLPGSKMFRWKVIPVPGRPDAILPLVPVDHAARVLVDAALRMAQKEDLSGIYGLYDPLQIMVRDLCDEIFKRYLPGAHPYFLEQIPSAVLRIQQIFTQIPPEVFQFALHPPDLSHTKFLEKFSNLKVPEFKTYMEIFFRGCGL